jgi:predicted dehydrogenase/nucleoside-diphosphate-sugar epimerase
MTEPQFRAGMVGAGHICEFHVAAVQALPGVELVGITDLDAARAEAAAREWDTRAFESLEALVDAGANVIHVLTPPSAHANVALEALERGCHVLIEKPITESVEDARRIGALASEKGLVASVDHSLLYDPQVLRVLEQVRAGAIGDVVGVDIFQSSEYPPYEGGPVPPHLRSAAYPWRDVAVHCLYLIQTLLGRIEDLDAEWRSLGGDPNLAFDEWRALVRSERGLGQFQLSWNAKPMHSQMVVHGTSGQIRADLFAMYLAKRSSTPLPKAAERVVNAYAESLRPLVDVPVGALKFVRKEVQAFQGLRNLVGDFYARLGAGEPPPVRVEEAAEVVGWVERVAGEAEEDQAARLKQFSVSPTADFLVTGASGKLGSAVVARLLEQGKSVRALVRRIPDQPVDGVEYCFGQLADSEAVDRAVKGVERVIHAGAAMAGGWPEHLGSTVVGTQNVMDASRRHGVRQVVHISSMSVVDWAGAAGRAPLDEGSALEPRADERGAYTRAKLEAEKIVSAAADAGLPCVILRPGQLFGGGVALLNGSVARRAGSRWVFLGDGQLPLPLVYMDDAVDAIMAAVERELVGGEVIQIVDPERVTQEQVLELAGAGADKRLRVPRGVVFSLGKLSEYPLGALGVQSPLALYRLRSALARVEFESTRAEQQLGWRPRVGVIEGIRRVNAAA